MTVTYLNKLYDFALKHANARKSLSTWLWTTEKANWSNKYEVLKDFPRAKILANSRARFEIVHNLYRLVALIDHEDKIVEIWFIGTHTEYDRIDPNTI